MVTVQGPWSPLLGRLSLGAIPDNPIIAGAFVFSAVLGAVLLGYLTFGRKWGYLYREWLTTVDHKKIGVMYIIIGLVMLFRGFIDALMMRTQQVLADGPHSPGFLGAAHGYLVPYHFDQIYSAHGTIMILFAATPILVGLMNVIVPLQIGARDMAFPYLNALGLWLTAVGAALIMLSLFLGDFSHAGWVGLTPLTEVPYSPGVGVDYWMWAIQISSVGTTLGAANLIATIIKMRAPGMTWGRLPIFTWTALSTNIIALTSFPVLGVALGLLGADRYFGTHFFTAGLGGNLMLYSDLFWIWGHPEVYFVILPAFGMMSEIIPTFAEKPLFGYATMVAASFAIAGISWSVWLHHFFTMGAGPSVNTFFSVATMVVGIPTGVKVFNWAFTVFRGRARFETPMLWAVGALFMLLLGGLTGMMLAMPPINYSVHNSVFVVAHFHTMLMVVIYGIMGAVSYWFPKVFGFKLNEALGKRFFWYFTAGTLMVFIPMYTSGFMGMTRRLDYLANPALFPFEVAEEVGIGLYIVSIYYFVRQLYASVRDRAAHQVGADAWGSARTLEWLTPSPVPFYNFAVTPRVHARDELVWRRTQGLDTTPVARYEDIPMPKNTPVPLVIGAWALGLGFGLVWRIWWLTDASFVLIVLTVIARSFVHDTDYTVKARDVQETEQGLQRRAQDAAHERHGVGIGAFAPRESSP
ncbi:cbb3-type cytochrome c oxidase subunit I [Acidiferrobacter sp.]|uniref:cbb3-type cytochrome c oxidase subunit I n=1 Tax=Acidiferrobacter sp. TaxID=1872107 RepID=UPI002607DB13|nr:cbb3-type cytochrome c oxidase subunit I [Acidiferrobacter sp.]